MQVKVIVLLKKILSIFAYFSKKMKHFYLKIGYQFIENPGMRDQVGTYTEILRILL